MSAGARYVPLAQVHPDPTYEQPGGGFIVKRTAYERDIDVADIALEPA